MPRKYRKHGKPDVLQVQVALKIRAPKGYTIAPQVLQQIIDRAVNGEELPRNVEFRGIFWRNPNRRGDLSHWRYHTGADLDKVAPRELNGKRYIDGVEVEDFARGSLQDAVSTLGGALYSGTVSF